MKKQSVTYAVLAGIISLLVLGVLTLPYHKFRPNLFAEAYLPGDVSLRYNSPNGVQVFRNAERKSISVYGDCRPVENNVRCDEISQFTGANLVPRGNDIVAINEALLAKSPEPAYTRTSPTGWVVSVYYLGIDGNGADLIFQVNVYNAGGQLVDDGLLIRVNNRQIISMSPRPGVTVLP